MPTCHETTDVLGYRECTRFGAWGDNLRLPRFFIQLGMATRVAPSLAGNAATSRMRPIGRLPHHRRGRSRNGTPGRHRAADGFGIKRGMFVAVDLEGGTIVRGETRTEMTGIGVFGSPTLTQNTAVALNAAAVVGSQRTVGHGLLGIEAAGGVRAVQYSFTSNYHDCETTTLYAEAAPLLEARAGYEHWFHRFMSVGATVSTSVIDRRSWMGGLDVGFHSRAFRRQSLTENENAHARCAGTLT